MKAKILIGTFVALALALAVSFGSLPSAAQGPTTGPTNLSPFYALYADFQPHQIPAGAWLWYKFDYGGENKRINIFSPNAGAAGLEFRVYTPEQARNIENEDRFVGRGNRDQVPCAEGRCASVDLTWQGAFKQYGTYYVLVINPTNYWKTFSLLITGENVTHGIPTPTPEPSPVPVTTSIQPVITSPVITTTMPTIIPPPPPPPPLLPPPLAVPSPTPVRAVENDSPYTAIYVRDNRDQNIPANTSMWYKFDYGGDRSRIWIQLYNGNVSGIWFAIFTPDQAIHFTDDKFIGRGMTQPVLCDQGRCTGNDLVWVGNFTVPGTYFIRVTNPNDKPWTFKLHIEGDNINIVE
ncbi:MAG: hypothetical protein FJ009_06930 [Chloroflexi bacterium]|nr:hypothetical protein [Chloroflexota bacterium]